MKLNLIILCLFTSMVTIAQDVIVTTDAKKIDAKIIEVSKEQIKYKDFDNLDGPTFILDVQEISSIIYSNGKVVLYNNQPAKQQQVDTNRQVAESETTSDTLKETPDNTATILTKSGKNLDVSIVSMDANGVTYIKNGKQYTLFADKIDRVLFANGQIKTYSNTSQAVPSQSNTNRTEDNTSVQQETVYKFSDFNGNILPRFSYEKVNVPGKKYKKYRYVGGNMVLTSSEFLNLLQMYCPEAYNYQRKATVFLVLECVFILSLPLVAVFAVLSISNSSKVLPTYNASCATKPLVEFTAPQDVFHDKVQIANIQFVEQ